MRPVDFLFPEMGAMRNEGLCPYCATLVDESSFTSEIAVREFAITGMCQKCQDEVFS